MHPLRLAVPASCVMLCATALLGCSASSTAPAFSPQEQQEMFKKETSGEMKLLIDLERQYGSNHSQVQQMKIELGLDPNRPAADQQ